MAKQKKAFNPFYVLLVLVGVAFTITACGYGVMTVRMLEPVDQSASDRFFDTYGVQLMIGQVIVLSILTLAAMGTDNYWTARSESQPETKEPDSQN